MLFEMHNRLLSLSIWFQHWNLDFCRLETRLLLFFIIINDINIVVAFVVIMCKVRPTWGWNWTCGDTSRDGLCLGPIQSESFMRLSQALLYLHCDPGSKLAKKVSLTHIISNHNRLWGVGLALDSWHFSLWISLIKSPKRYCRLRLTYKKN